MTHDAVSDKDRADLKELLADIAAKAKAEAEAKAAAQAKQQADAKGGEA